MIGVYKITTKHNSKIYIGSSENIEKRFTTHCSRLKRGVHHSPYFQAVYNKYGLSNLEFSIIEILDSPEKKIEREQHWMDYYKSYDRIYGYNVSKLASSNVTGEKIIYQYDLEGNFIKEYNSIEYAKKEHCLKTIKYKKGLSSGGFQWRLFKEHKIDSILKIYCCYSIEGKFVRSFSSFEEIKSFFHVKSNSISNIARCVKTGNLCLGYLWKIYNNYNFPKVIQRYKKKTRAKKLGQFDKNNNLIAVFSSLTETALFLKVKPENLHRVIDSNNPTYKTCRGFIWKYL